MNLHEKTFCAEFNAEHVEELCTVCNAPPILDFFSVHYKIE